MSRDARPAGAAPPAPAALRRGPLDAITDVSGVAVGHSPAGLTAVLPYPRSVLRRKVWGAFRRLGSVGDVSGLHVLEDFGILSSPIVIGPLAWFGDIYDALIEDGFRRDPELSIDAGWPPLVIGIPSAADPDPAAPLPARAVIEALESAGPRFALGPAGAASRWASGGWPGGIGTASRLTPAGHAIGVLAARSAGGGASALVAATDAPLGPLGLGRVAECALVGLARDDAPSAGAGAAALAFTTAQPVERAFERGTHRLKRRATGAGDLALLCSAIVEAVREAVALSARAAGPPAR